MKVSQNWLTEMLGSALDTERVLERLTLAGLEVDGHETIDAVDKVVVAKVTGVQQHPDADRLRVCDVNDGQETHQIVCGAPNVRPDMTVALAQVGAKLPGGIKIRKSKLRGVESAGMLCSAAELGLGQDHDGILDLPSELVVGSPLHEALGLPDTVIDIDLTPNRGDCFSTLGVAREVATFCDIAFDEPSAEPCADRSGSPVSPKIDTPEVVPVFSAATVTGIDSAAKTPLWMVERLRRSGVRAISPVVDITNFVMLEFGQPMHGYDLDKVQGELGVRYADGEESLVLLDGKTITPDKETLVITDDSGAIGLAGIMGGESTMVDEHTTNVLFEAAHFTPSVMAGKARRYNMHTDASLRFERGVDAYGHERAQERAAQLLIEIAGGVVGPLFVERHTAHLRSRDAVVLRAARLAKVLGCDVASDEVTKIFERLGFGVAMSNGDWHVSPPTWRFDIAIEEDLIEEVARVYGYDRIPVKRTYAETPLAPASEQRVSEELLRDAMAARGYAEAVTYSFVDPRRHALLDIAAPGPELLNPISSELSVMRGTLLCGLLEAAQYNLARQRQHVRIFEIGRVFDGDRETVKMAGLLAGKRHHEQWSSKDSDVDFFDIKADLEALLATTGRSSAVRLERTQIDTLHPGQAARISLDDEDIGVIGALHPRVSSAFDIDNACIVFEIDVDAAFARRIPIAAPISKFPHVRRDIAIVIDEKIAVADVVDTIKKARSALIRDVIVFDVYQGKGIEPGLKSVALGLILLDSSRTLTDDVSEAVVADVVTALQDSHSAKLRE
ncbi:MAG: phenylalanine--tRNA ligase subunit beta [Pseudomonadota bacterium]